MLRSQLRGRLVHVQAALVPHRDGLTHLNARNVRVTGSGGACGGDRWCTHGTLSTSSKSDKYRGATARVGRGSGQTSVRVARARVGHSGTNVSVDDVGVLLRGGHDLPGVLGSWRRA